MKYRLLGLGIMVFMLLTAGIATWYNPEQPSQRIHQHQTARADTGCDCDKSELCTHLPLVIINTKGQEIPGAPTGNRDYFGEEIYTTTEDGSDYAKVEISVINNPDKNNHPSDTAAFTTSSYFRIRGHASRHFEKSQYLLKFIDENGQDVPFEVMGADAHNEWILNGPYLDKSLIRNYMWYNISGEIMDYAPNVRYCEVILDGDYRGVYLMEESITNGDNGRLNLRDNIKDSTITGYLLRLDRTTKEDLDSTRDINTYLERNMTVHEDIAIRYPGKTSLTEEKAKEIELEFSAFEKALYSYDYDTDNYGFFNYIDVDNFVDYFIINEFTRNVDAGRYSTFLYKELDKKYKLCVWDFNNALDNFPDDEIKPQDFALVDRLWYNMMFKEEGFADLVIKRYQELRSTYLSETYLTNYMDETLEWLGPAIERNNLRWADAITQWEPLTPQERNDYSQEEAVERMKRWIHQRGEWLDENIHGLKAEGHPSRNKVYNH